MAEEEIGGPIMGMWHFPLLSRLREAEASKTGGVVGDGVVQRALDRAPGVIVKHMGRAAGQATADIAGNAAREAISEGIGGIFRDRPMLRRLRKE